MLFIDLFISVLATLLLGVVREAISKVIISSNFMNLSDIHGNI